MAQVGFGASISFSSSYLAEIVSIEIGGVERDALETTHAGSTSGIRTFIPSDLENYGQLTVRMRRGVGVKPPISSAAETVTITWGKEPGQTTAATWAFSGFLISWSASSPFDGLVETTATIKATGDVTVTAGS